MSRRLLLALTLTLALAGPALGDDVGAKKQAVDSKIATLHSTLAQVEHAQSSLRGQIDGLSSRIQALESKVGDVTLALRTLEQDLALRQQRLGKLNELYRLQSRRLTLLTRQYRLAVDRLNERLVAIFESPQPSTLDVFLGATSIQDALDQASYLTLIGQQDRAVAREVAASRHAMQLARRRTAAVRARVHGEERALAVRASQENETRSALVDATNSLSSAKQKKLVALSDLTEQEREAASEIDALQQVSASLGAQIRAAQARNSDVTPSAAGLIWPVQGPITSPFGWRWGRMHQGIDIGAATGTPIRAAAAGRVIYCGWEEGYGNLIVLDNGGDLATAYAHQSALAVSCGQDVSQGEVIGYVGCTGHCTGPHLHFEVRVNGNPVDPLGYL
ncbi:MAG TPA: peptidoglycan DD-metalloendopeptidase family protein [Gaiellaceae bacterium]|nr:peptidoglycan DD-metalloendopeptidase family protein [Gaiellaceae bacterium]